LENLIVISSGGTVASSDSTMLLARLNMIAKQYQGTADGAPGLKINSRQRVTLFPQKGQQMYLVGPASTDARATTAYGRTTISANEALGQTTLSITSNTDTTTNPGTTVTMTSGDIVGIELDDGSIQWTTISGTPSTTMDVAASLTAAAASGNYVYWFTSRAQRFPVIESAVLRDENLNDTELTIFRTARDYDVGVADKYADGDPTCILIEPLRITTRVTLDSQPTDVTKQIVLTVQYPSEDYDATTDDIAFPQEAFRFLAWELSFEVCDAFGKEWTPSMEKKRLEARNTYFSLNPEVSNQYFQSGGL
jgi:hypothetical protein